MLLQANDIKGVYAIVPTPTVPGGDHWSATNTVNVEESARLVDQLIKDGVDAIIALGTTGECATLTEDEYKVFADAVITAANGRVPTIIGATALGTHQTVERLRFLRQQGATGSMLGLPMWQPCVEDMAVKFYESIAEGFPDLSIMVYMNARAFRFDFPLTFWERIAKVAPNVTSAKYTNAPPYADCVSVTEGKIKFLPIDMAMLPYAEAQPDVVDCCWTTGASMGPQVSIALMDAVNARDWDAARAIDADIKWATETFMPPDPAQFQFFNIQIEKLRMEGSGYCAPGPIRPPYDVVPDEYKERAYECGRRWAELCTTKYAGVR